jgi:hypothetical protein
VYQSEISDPSGIEIKPEVIPGFYCLKMQANNKIQWFKVIKQN